MGTFKIINRTDFKTEDLSEIASALLEGQLVSSFYLICQTPAHDGLSISNIDKPIIIIDVLNLKQFAEVFVHELAHLQQHAKNYADEDFSREVITTDSRKTAYEQGKHDGIKNAKKENAKTGRK